MKTKYPDLFGMLAVLMLVAGFVVPASLASPPAVQADPGICKWDTLKEPGNLPGTEVIARGTDIIDLAVGSDSNTVVAVVDEGPTSYSAGPTNLFKWSNTRGLFWTSSKWLALTRKPEWGGTFINGFPADRLTRQCYQVAMAPDDPDFFAITTDNGTPLSGPKEVWITRNGGSDWSFTNLATKLSDNETVRCIDISVNYGGVRDIAVGTATGNGNINNVDHGRILVLKSSSFSSWQDQKVNDHSGSSIDLSNGLPDHEVDFFAVKFSPFYASDSSLAVVFSDNVTYTACTYIDPITHEVKTNGTQGATFYNVAVRDIDQNATSNWAFATPGVEVKGSGAQGASPGSLQLNKATLQLPSDFSGQTASLRRAYISLDAFGSDNRTSCSRDGIFRIDDTTVSTLMDTSQIPDKAIYSIAYFGTYSTGKLMAGERMGYPCTATVPTWFTDSPTNCAGGCWYPALKPATGAACMAYCNSLDGTCHAQGGIGACIVGWSPHGDLAYAATGSQACTTGRYWYSSLLADPAVNDESALSISRDDGETWNQISLIDTTITKFTDVAPSPDGKTVYLASVNRCEATACTANTTASVSWTNGVANSCNITFSAINLNCGNTLLTSCNTTACSSTDNFTTDLTYSINWSVTVLGTCSSCAHCPRCSGITVSATENITGKSPPIEVPLSIDLLKDCTMDSVWRTSDNPDVTLPLPPQPVGTYWERVFTHPTAPTCTDTQTDYALLRTVPYCADPTGQNVAWAVYDHDGINPHGVAAWSPDFGNYWSMLTPRNPVQDFCFESQTVLYFLSPDGYVQKMPYTGTAWSSSLPDIKTQLDQAHTIAAYPEGKVLVGAASTYNAAYFATSYCGNFNTDSPVFTLQALPGNTGTGGNIHVAFDPAFNDNNTYYIADDGDGGHYGSVFRNNPAAPLRWQDTDMMSVLNGAIGCPHPFGQYGIVLAFTGSALYSAHKSNGITEGAGIIECGVDRTIDDGTGRFGPLSGLPKPGIAWDHLDIGLKPGVCFTLEPSSLKICGCCTLDTDSTLYAIDNADYDMATGTGLIWAFTDCLAKRGPALVTDDKALIGCDPVSGRAAEVNLCWEQLCVANSYDLEIAKDANFTNVVIELVPEDYCGIGYQPIDVTSPCVFFPAGGVAPGLFYGTNSSLALFSNLECGQTYYWRVKARSCATQQPIRSPWSETRSFTVKAGLPVVSPYLGLQLLAPNNGCLGCPVKPASFSWSPYQDTTKYKFDLATDSEMTQIVKEAEVTTTAYEYDGTLNYSTNYFWRVMAEEPAPSDWSATFSFQTEAAPVPVTPTPAPATPIWVWVVIAIGAILVIVTLVLIFKTRRV
jgi:hypothetical protein